MIFDKTWYEKTYEDVAKSGVDSLSHYLNFGASEGRFSHVSMVPSDLRQDGTFSEQLKFLKSKIEDSDLKLLDENKLYTFSRFQIDPQIQLKNPLFTIFKSLEEFKQNTSKAQILFSELRKYKYLKYLFRFKKNIFIVFHEKNNELIEIIVSTPKGKKIFDFYYPFNNTKVIIFQLLNIILYEKVQQKSSIVKVNFLNFMGKYSIQVKIFKKIYKRNLKSRCYNE